MANLDHTAIYKAYPNAKRIDGSKIFDTSGNEITIEQSKVDAARKTLDDEAAKVLYQTERTGEAGTTDTIYLPLPQQLDMIYWDKVNGTTTWQDHVAAVKSKYPKPN